MEAQYQIYDLLDDAAEARVELDQMLEEFYQGDEIRGKVEEGLQAKIKAIEAEIAENRIYRQKIRLSIVSCLEMSKLSPAVKVSPVVRKKIQQAGQEATKEVPEAQQLLNNISTSQFKVLHTHTYHVVFFKKLIK